MSKIAQAFDHGKAFIPFVTAGDPDLETTKELLPVLQESGADLIEIGIPFSDPVAEGIVIQKADERALAAGTTTDKIFDMVESIQDKMHVPMVFMTYANVIFVYGIEKFAKRSKEIGMSGVIIPDVPFEEKEEMDSVFSKYDLDVISLIAPTSHDRIRAIAAEAKGFVYCVSSLGVTGMPQHDQQRSCADDRTGKEDKRHPMCHRIWNFHAGTGKRNVGIFGWCNCRKCHCKTG